MRTFTAVRVSSMAALLAGLLLFGTELRAQPKQRANVTKTAVDFTALHAGQKATAAIVLDIPAGFHAQSRTPLQENLIKFQVRLDKNDAVTYGEVVYPPGTIEEYPKLGKLSVYTGKVVLLIPFEVKADARPGDLKLTGSLFYQLCDDKVCFPPERPKFSIETKVVPAGEEVKPNEADQGLFKAASANANAPTTRAAGAVEPAPPATVPSATRSAATEPTAAPTTTAPTTAALDGGSPPPAAAAGQAATGAPPVSVRSAEAEWGAPRALAVAFLAGILFNIVPCVLPVLPLKVLGFAEVAQHDRGKTLLLSTVFGLGIVSVFAVLSLFVLVLKTISWGEQFSNPYFAWGIVVVLLALSLWLFGALNVNLPAGAYAFTPRHDTFVGNYLWGILTAVLSTPCTGPLFVPVMGWAALQPQALGVTALMTVGVGMAAPYVVLSAFPEVARRFPRVGPWSELFKQMLGFILLAFTVFFAAGRFTSGAGKWWAIVPVAALGALYLMARTVQLSKEARPVAISSFISVGMVTAAVLLALRFTDFGGSGASAVAWIPYSDDALAAARKADKVVLVKFTADWCLNCQYVEGTVFHDATAIAALRKHDVVTLKADLTDEDAAGWPLLRKLTATGGIPLTAIYAPGYAEPVKIDSVYTTGTLVSTLDRLDAARTASLQ
jgi:thiol:disulfide interchange protein